MDNISPSRLPSIAELEYEFLHISDDRSKALKAAIAINFALASIAIILRMTARRLSKSTLLADDYTILAAWVVVLGQLLTSITAIPLGAAKHVILIKNPTAYAKNVIVSEVFYVMGAALVKCSILLLYRRLFGSNGRFKILLWCIGAFVVTYSLIEILVIILGCRPIKAVWDMSVTPEYCVNLSLGGIIVGSINAATDFVTLFLPVPMVWRLKMKKKWKMQLIGIFLLGGFVCVGSIYRVTTLHKLSLTDATWNDVDPAIWAMVENSIGIVSACLPTLRPLFNLVARGHHCTRLDGCTRCTRKPTKASGSWDSTDGPELKQLNCASQVGERAPRVGRPDSLSDIESQEEQEAFHLGQATEGGKPEIAITVTRPGIDRQW